MRKFRLALFVIFGALMLAAPAFASQKPATAPNYLTALEARLVIADNKNMQASRKMSFALPREVHFCGQCSSDDACGSGWKCCGPSSCRECKNVVTCP